MNSDSEEHRFTVKSRPAKLPRYIARDGIQHGEEMPSPPAKKPKRSNENVLEPLNTDSLRFKSIQPNFISNSLGNEASQTEMENNSLVSDPVHLKHIFIGECEFECSPSVDFPFIIVDNLPPLLKS
jgi:hypothetical protein